MIYILNPESRQWIFYYLSVSLKFNFSAKALNFTTQLHLTADL